MKICIVQAWGFESLDGSNLRVYFLIKELLSRGHELEIINSSKKQADYSAKIFNCKTHAAGIEISRWDPLWLKFYKYIAFILRSRSIIAGIDYDVSFGISLLNALVVATVKKRLSAILYVDFMSNYYNYRASGILLKPVIFRLIKYLEHFTIKNAGRVMTITEAMKALIPAKYRVKTFVVPDGADTEALKPGIDPSRIRGKYNLKDKTVIGYQGGIEKWDGLQFLAEISSEIKKEIPDIKFLIAGKGSYLNKIKEILTKNGTIGDCIFLGWVQSSRIPEIMSACDLNVVPIPNHPATSPLITFRLLESMAAGVSVIVNKLPGILEIADESMVFFTNVEDAKTFADDIIKAVKTPAGARDKMKAKSRKKAETLDWRLIARKDADFVENRLPAAG